MALLKGEHDPGEVNTDAWSKANAARQKLQARRASGAPELQNPDITTPGRLSQEVHGGADLGRHQTIRISDPDDYVPGSIEERLARLGRRPIQEQMRERLVGSQAPEPVMEVVSPAGAEGARVTRHWAVDDEEFGKQAGDEMTEAEYETVCKRLKPVHWDEDGNPDIWAPAHDAIDPTEGLARSVPTRAERAQATQYSVRGLASEGMGGDHIKDTDHTILPEPYVEPIDPELP